MGEQKVREKAQNKRRLIKDKNVKQFKIEMSTMFFRFLI